MFMIQFMSVFRIMCFDILDVNVEVLGVFNEVIAITTIIIWQHRCSSNVLELKGSDFMCITCITMLSFLFSNMTVRNLCIKSAETLSSVAPLSIIINAYSVT